MGRRQYSDSLLGNGDLEIDAVIFYLKDGRLVRYSDGRDGVPVLGLWARHAPPARAAGSAAARAG